MAVYLESNQFSRIVGHLRFRDKLTNLEHHATATMIGEKHIFTSAHVLWDRKHGGRSKSVVFYLWYDGFRYEWKVNSKMCYLCPGWRDPETQTVCRDYAVAPLGKQRKTPCDVALPWVVSGAGPFWSILSNLQTEMRMTNSALTDAAIFACGNCNRICVVGTTQILLGGESGGPWFCKEDLDNKILSIKGLTSTCSHDITASPVFCKKIMRDIQNIVGTHMFVNIEAL